MYQSLSLASQLIVRLADENESHAVLAVGLQCDPFIDRPEEATPVSAVLTEMVSWINHGKSCS